MIAAIDPGSDWAVCWEDDDGVHVQSYTGRRDTGLARDATLWAEIADLPLRPDVVGIEMTYDAERLRKARSRRGGRRPVRLRKDDKGYMGAEELAPWLGSQRPENSTCPADD